MTWGQRIQCHLDCSLGPDAYVREIMCASGDPNADEVGQRPGGSEASKLWGRMETVLGTSHLISLMPAYYFGSGLNAL